ncbi:hypothetical protein [Rasiella sp. SM2506]|uniref:hypothetical protein n=1 Tax=Rasiella sp. SM2506 TaxID=3423914 RepID=UPI003D7B9045
MILIVNRFLLRKGFNGITLWPFVVLRNKQLKEDTRLLNHERIHLYQQAELLIVFFYIWYGVEFLVRWFQYKNRHLAYRNITFEREAYANEKDFNYCKQRSFWRFVNYL